jgi:hypothetical protein
MEDICWCKLIPLLPTLSLFQFLFSSEHLVKQVSLPASAYSFAILGAGIDYECHDKAVKTCKDIRERDLPLKLF